MMLPSKDDPYLYLFWTAVVLMVLSIGGAITAIILSTYGVI